MKFGVLCFVVAAVENARAVLSPAGENVCLYDEKYVDVIQVRELVPVKIYRVEWCWRIPPRCQVESEVLKPMLVNKQIPRVRIVARCCRGYREIVQESRCVPVCNEPCLNGDCIAPDTCLCESGFYGDRCEKPCESGTWGRKCLERCDCHNNATCDGVHGDCTCTPGWRGFKCEFPCDPGRYGMNCEGRCNCNGELCNHVSGECEAITSTTLATAVTTTTTEEAVFETTTEEAVFETTTTDSTTEIADLSNAIETNSEDTETEYTTPGNVSTFVEIVDGNVTQSVETMVESTTPTIEDLTPTEPKEIQIYVEMEDPDLYLKPNRVNETDKDNEVEGSQDFSSHVKRTKFNLFSLLENLSIVTGIFILLFVFTMVVVMVGHYRKMRKIGFECQKKNVSQDFAIHRFYGGSVIPAKAILENQLCTTDVDFETEQPKMMTFKPLPDKNPDKEYFMKKAEISQDKFDIEKDLSLDYKPFQNNYRNMVAEFEYDVPKSTTFVPAGYKYG